MGPVNKLQRLIIVVGAIAILACCLFPPWVHTFKAEGIYSEESAGYSLLISPPARKSKSVKFGIKLDSSRLLLQIFIITISTGLGVFLSHKKA